MPLFPGVSKMPALFAPADSPTEAQFTLGNVAAELDYVPRSLFDDAEDDEDSQGEAAAAAAAAGGGGAPAAAAAAAAAALEGGQGRAWRE